MNMEIFKEGNSLRTRFVRVEDQAVKELEKMESIAQKRLYAAQHGITASAMTGTKTLEECLEELKEWEAIDRLKRDQPDRLSLVVESLPDCLMWVNWKTDYKFWSELFAKYGGEYGEHESN